MNSIEQMQVNILRDKLNTMSQPRHSFMMIDELPYKQQMELVAHSEIAINYITVSNVTEEMMRLHELKWVL